MLVPNILNWLISSSFVFILFLTTEFEYNGLEIECITTMINNAFKKFYKAYFFKTYLNYLLLEVNFKIILNLKSAISRTRKNDFVFVWYTGI
jgi:hypothetical protein